MSLLLINCQAQIEEHESAKASPTLSVADSGILEGFIRFEGDVIPASTLVQNTTDREGCDPEQSLEDLLVSTRNRGVENAIVAVNNVPPEMIPPRKPRRLVLDNKECRFSPHASVLETGGTIVATNSDALLHTTHLYGAMETNISLPFKGVSISRTVTVPGMIIVKCDIHGWMQAFIRIDDHPYHAVTGSDGSFRIQGLPPGSYELEVWHEKLGSQTTTIDIEAGELESIEMTYSHSPR